MGFSFRSLYTDDDQFEQSAVLSSLPAASVADSAVAKSSLSQALGSGIPGPLKGSGPFRSAYRRHIDETVFTSLDTLEPVSSSNEASDVTASADRSSVEVPATRSAPVSTVKNPGQAGITLRAVFATSEEFTLERIAALTAGFSGITSCVIITPSRAVLATKALGSAHQLESSPDFPDLESFQPVCDLLGSGEVSGLMLRSEVGQVSCFSFAGVCLMARHSGEELEPGLWEKLTLVTQATAEMNLSD